jgi:hypothetical protein
MGRNILNLTIRRKTYVKFPFFFAYILFSILSNSLVDIPGFCDDRAACTTREEGAFRAGRSRWRVPAFRRRAR